MDDSALTDEEVSNMHEMFEVEGTKKQNTKPENVEGQYTPSYGMTENIRSINHRGWYKAPENTLSAYRESYKNGFKYVECDVQFTKDGVAVLLHDDTIDRTSNGTGNISELTYAEASQFDYSYDDSDTVNDFSLYRGEKIPTFEEFIKLCKRLELHPYIELKGSITDAQAKQLVEIVKNCDMLHSVSWISFNGNALINIINNCPTARVGWVLTSTDATKIEANNIEIINTQLKTGQNKVFIDIWHSLATQAVVDLCIANDIALEVWTVNDSNTILNLHPYVSGVSSDSCHAENILKDYELSLIPGNN